MGELGPLQPRISRQVPGRARVNRLIKAAAAGVHPPRTASWGRPSAPQGSSPWVTGSLGRTMKGGGPGEGLALTPRSPAPPLPQAAAWHPPGTPPELPLPPWTCLGTPGESAPRPPVLSPGDGGPVGCTGKLQSQRQFQATVLCLFHPPAHLASRVCAVSP